MQVLKIESDDVCLTLTSGGCNALNLLIQGARQVVAVDCNPAQTALLELKAMAIRFCPYGLPFSFLHASVHYIFVLGFMCVHGTYFSSRLSDGAAGQSPICCA